MRLMSPRKTAWYHTLEFSPSVTSPTTTAVWARYTPRPSAGCFARKMSNCARRSDMRVKSREGDAGCEGKTHFRQRISTKKLPRDLCRAGETTTQPANHGQKGGAMCDGYGP